VLRIAEVGFYILVYSFCLFEYAFVTWRGTDIIWGSVSVRNAVCYELLRWGLTN